MAFSLSQERTLCPTLVNSQTSECWPQSVESPSLSTHLDFFPGYSPNTTYTSHPFVQGSENLILRHATV